MQALHDLFIQHCVESLLHVGRDHLASYVLQLQDSEKI